MASAQERYTISGHIRDVATGEELVGARYFIVELKTGNMANNYGFYSVTVPSGTYTVRYSFIGYVAREMTLDVTRDIKQDIELTQKTYVIEEIVVTGKAAHDDENITSTETGTIRISPNEISSVPILFGEKDIIKTMQLLPGVTAVSEGNSGFFVRGGSPDQNLILLDEAPVYNASHLMGFFSVFNSDALKDVKLIKGAAPPEYGGRLSSVLDIRMKEGNMKKYRVSGGLGLVSSRLTVQGPIVKDKGSFIISGRRTYADVFLAFAKDKELKKSRLYFYDLNMKANYFLGENDRLFISGYMGRDVLGNGGEFGVDWGNSTTTVRWNHIFNSRLFLNSSLIYSQFDYVFGFDIDKNGIDVTSSITDVNLKEDFEYFMSSKCRIKFGLDTIYHTFLPGKITATSESSVNSFSIDNKYALETAPYIGHEYDPTNALKISYGVRYSLFSVLGPGKVYRFNEDGDVIETTKYAGREVIKTYAGPEPRFAATYRLNDVSSTKLSYARNRQYIHLLSNTSVSTPFDVWHPSTAIVKPQIADQVAAGYFRNFGNNGYETSMEIYYKDLKRQIDYKTGANILLDEYVESELVFGKGWAYGAEYLLKKNTGKLTGWLGYTLAKTERKYALINRGKPYPARHDRIHDFSLVGTYKRSEKWTFSFAWVFHSGDAVSFPSGKYRIENNTVSLYTERNCYRMPAYHRLDLGATYIRKKTGDSESSWNFSLYNAYGHKNAYVIYFRENKDNPDYTEAVRTSLFTFFPSITYNFAF